MKRKLNKGIIWLITACMILALLPTAVLASGDAPTVVTGQETQAGTAAPASNDASTAAVPYSADMSGWFTDAENDTLSYSVVSATDESSNDVSADISITDATIAYAPAAAQASQNVTIIVKANDGTSDSTSDVTITVAVGAVPPDTNSAPAVVTGQETQTGTAAPASNDTLTAAVPYSADMSGWFTDAENDMLSYSLVSATDESSNDVSTDVYIADAAIAYTPAATQALQNVIIIVKANDGTSDSTSDVTITVAVGAVPPDTNSAPAVVTGQETQTGTAVPASNDTLTAAIPYSADMSGWFTDAENDSLSYSVVSATDESSNDVSADISITDAAIAYTPAAAQASQNVTIIVKANDGFSDSTSNVTITVAVGAIPANYYELAIGDQSAGGAGYKREITITDNYGTGLDGKYLVVQYTAGTGSSAKVSVVMIGLNSSSTEVTVSYQVSGTTVDAWLTGGMPDLTGPDMGVPVYANASSN